MPGDWMSMLGYGGTLSIPAGTVAAFPLMTTPTAASYDASLPYGGLASDTVRDLSIQRIVGQVFQRTGPNAPLVRQWGWRLMALPWDFTNGFFDVPWLPGSNLMLDAQLTDIVRWWAERFYQTMPGALELVGVDAIFHPWWTFIDIEPKALVGGHTGEWPALVIDNTYAADDLNVVHRLRSFGYSRT